MDEAGMPQHREKPHLFLRFCIYSLRVMAFFLPQNLPLFL
ncbi:hypothetical protein [Enterobacter hormaechei]|nr:hypothetical protein [Enterobacter hormaechei]